MVISLGKIQDRTHAKFKIGHILTEFFSCQNVPLSEQSCILQLITKVMFSECTQTCDRTKRQLFVIYPNDSWWQSI
jgi:hypothetical protein